MYKKVDLEKLYKMAKKASGYVDTIYLHWSAGRYHQFFDDYHINIDKDGSIYTSTDSLTTYLSHTWQRNSGAVGVSLSCAYGAEAGSDDIDFGKYPPTQEQIDAMAQVVAVLCAGLNLPIDYGHVMTHCEAAEEDGYGPSTTCERWDLWLLPDLPGTEKLKPGGEVLRGKAVWWKEKLGY